ncbi:hypothetical protein MTR_2g046720 [Medicago truncatula]|uniref:Uncharacterized protein n=1 Tax=Medicago truncatula TaxID=3880 RepID=A0A072V6Q7_MEDTR|nr:hypothetical protein MTR_2g046720 [Medicago truncatula]
MVGNEVEMGPTTEPRDSAFTMSCSVHDTIYLNYYRHLPPQSTTTVKILLQIQSQPFTLPADKRIERGWMKQRK